MVGSKIDDPYKGLAASIVLRAQHDCKGKIESTAGTDMAKALIQHDATRWLESNPWCECMLCLGLPLNSPEVTQEFVAKQALKRRKKSYRKYLPQEIGVDDWMPITYLAELTKMDKDKMYHAVCNGGLYATKEDNGYWYSTLTEVAIALVAGELKMQSRRHNTQEGGLRNSSKPPSC